MPRGHVLVLDDERSILTTLQKALSLEGYTVDVAGGIAVAEEKLAKRSYDIALFDVALPDGDGIGLLQRLRASGSDMPVVMMSGHASIDAAVRATRLGAIDFLEKPLSTDRLILVLENTPLPVFDLAVKSSQGMALGSGPGSLAASAATTVLPSLDSQVGPA